MRAEQQAEALKIWRDGLRQAIDHQLAADGDIEQQLRALWLETVGHMLQVMVGEKTLSRWNNLSIQERLDYFRDNELSFENFVAMAVKAITEGARRAQALN